MAQWQSRWRILVTLVLVGLTLLGTVRGLDDDFPFGPLRMYAHTHRRDSPVKDTWAWGVDATGRTIRLNQARVGIRRAEIEGQLRSFQAHPERLKMLVDACAERHPNAPKLVLVEVRTRRIQMHDGKPTGRVTTRVRVRWVP